MIRIIADRNKCAGAGMCVMTAPEVFDQDEDEGLVQLIVDSVDGDRRSEVLQAEALCPARAIKVLDEPISR